MNFIKKVMDLISVKSNKVGTYRDFLWLEDGSVFHCSGTIVEDDEEHQCFRVQFCRIAKEGNVELKNPHLKQLIEPHTIKYSWIIKWARVYDNSSMRL